MECILLSTLTVNILQNFYKLRKRIQDMTDNAGFNRIKIKSHRKINWQQQGVAYLFLLPFLAIFTLVNWYPILKTILSSFQEVNLSGFKGWVGFLTITGCLANKSF